MSALNTAIGIVLGFALGWFGAQWWRRRSGRDPIRKHPPGMEEKDPYRLNPAVISRTEDSCYHALLALTPDDHSLLVKVRLADLLQVNYGAGDRAEAHARIGNKSIAFLICDRSLAPKVGFNLVAAGGDRAELQTAEFIDRVCKKVGLPLITLPIRPAYTADDLRDLVAPRLQATNAVV